MALPESVQEILKRMTPPWAKKAGEALPYVAAPLGVMGSELLSAGSKTLRFLGAGLPVSPEDVENMRQTNRQFLSDTYRGVPGAEKAAPSPQEKVIQKANTPEAGAPTETNAVVTNNAKAPTDIYSAVEMMDDANFKKFVDKDPSIPGIGYIKGKGVDFQRVIEKPSNDSNDVDLSGMPVSAAADLIRAISDRDKGVAAIGQNEVIKAGQLADRKANTEIRREATFDKMLDTYSPASSQTDANGNTIKNKKAGLAIMYLQGYKDFPETAIPQVENIKQEHADHTSRWLSGFNQKFPKSKLTDKQKKELSDKDFMGYLLSK